MKETILQLWKRQAAMKKTACFSIKHCNEVCKLNRKTSEIHNSHDYTIDML